MKKKFFLSIITLMFSLLFFTSNINAASSDVRSYEFADNNTRLYSTNNTWNDGLFKYYEKTGIDLRPYISDFTPKLTLNIVGYREVQIIFKRPASRTYYDYSSSSDWSYSSVNLFGFGSMISTYEYYNYYGYSYYGDINHRNGNNVQPFFLFVNGSGTAYAPTFVERYDINYLYASFSIPNLPTNQNFKLGISFSTLHCDYYGDAYDTYFWEVGNSNIVLSDNLYLNY